jgi:arsenate reductase
MTVTIYHNPRCSKSRQALALLEERGIKPQIIEYLKNPPTADELAAILKKMGRKPADILRAKDAQEAGINPAGMSDEALIKTLVAHPITIERPIVVSGNKAALGRPPEAVLSIL